MNLWRMTKWQDAPFFKSFSLRDVDLQNVSSVDPATVSCSKGSLSTRIRSVYASASEDNKHKRRKSALIDISSLHSLGHFCFCLDTYIHMLIRNINIYIYIVNSDSKKSALLSTFFYFCHIKFSASFEAFISIYMAGVKMFGEKWV